MASAARTLRERLLAKINQRASWRWAKRGLYFLLFIAIFANFIANDKPYYCEYQGEWHAPLFRAIAVDLGLASWPADQATWRWYEIEALENVYWPPIAYSPTRIDLYQKFQSPFAKQQVERWSFRHWLGTDGLGRDTLASLIWGTRIAMLIGIASMIISTIIGLFLGSIAGFFANDRWLTTRAQRVGGTIGLLCGIYWGFIVRRPALDLGSTANYYLTAIFLLIGLTLLGSYLGRLLTPRSGHIKPLPLDDFIMRGIETLNAIPALLLLLAIVAVIKKPTLLSLILILGLLRWTGIARFVRGELLRVRSLEYMQATQVMGLPPALALIRHALPNALGPVYVAVAFGIAGAILVEAGLSFIGIGVPEDIVTWGMLLRNARNAASAWWLAIFPGLAIFLTITVFNLLGEAISEEVN
ncbi:MAG: ABC transporter permease [Bacteroidota bacterium]